MLIAQAFNSVTYHRRLNILSTLTGNRTKIKDIIKGQRGLDDGDNEELFGSKFSEKLSDIVSAKQKSKSLFTGLYFKKQNPYGQG